MSSVWCVGCHAMWVIPVARIIWSSAYIYTIRVLVPSVLVLYVCALWMNRCTFFSLSLSLYDFYCSIARWYSCCCCCDVLCMQNPFLMGSVPFYLNVSNIYYRCCDTFERGIYCSSMYLMLFGIDCYVILNAVYVCDGTSECDCICMYMGESECDMRHLY